MSYEIGEKPPRLCPGGFSSLGVMALNDGAEPKLLVIDNYDSFTYNLVQMFMHYDLNIEVQRNDMISLKQIAELSPDYLLISPGPRDPAHAGISIPLVKSFCGQIPILGICLGLQCINEAFGGVTVRAPLPLHGKTSLIRHNHVGILKGIPSPFQAARYHSLMARQGGKDLVVTAHSDDGVIMGLSHPELPLHAVQFHPESFLSENGFLIVENFLRLGPLKSQLDPRILDRKLRRKSSPKREDFSPIAQVGP